MLNFLNQVIIEKCVYVILKLSHCSNKLYELLMILGPKKRKRLFQDKLSKWAQEKASLTEQESNLQSEEAEFKREIWKLKINREQELLQEVKDRIKFQVEKHASEMELLALQKSSIKLKFSDL